MNIKRSEHPKPQFERESWMNLNGEWEFEIDNGRSGKERGLFNNDTALNKKIIVPFCPQSELYGINHKDFMYGVWYKRSVTLSKEQVTQRTVLHFGAVDYKCEAFVNGESVGVHKGGYVSFCFDISSFVKEGENIITVYAEDDERNSMIPRGKQSEEYHSHGCDYTRTTGIWQTVWLEFTPDFYIQSVKYYPDAKAGTVMISAIVCGEGELCIEASYKGKSMGQASAKSCGENVQLVLPLSEIHLWEPGHGRLYDLSLSYGDDHVKSYVGLRNVRIDGYKFLINGKSVFQRLVLDQGFYMDGIYTAISDEELKKDIERSLACGFNGARLHQKVFEERFLYHCDKLGYIVWGEYPNWGLDHSRAEALFAVLPEWMEELDRDFNHPAIIGWCPFNETWDYAGRKQDDEVIKTVYSVTKAIDKTRPCIDTSGNYHVETDIYDVHDYNQNPVEYMCHFAPLEAGAEFYDEHSHRQHYDGKKPVFVSEYGGIGWSVEENAWGYGNNPTSEEEFIERFRGLTDVLLDNERIMGLCYTQLTNVEQEQNGLYTYDRKPKFNTEIFKKILSRKAKIED